MTGRCCTTTSSEGGCLSRDRSGSATLSRGVLGFGRDRSAATTDPGHPHPSWVPTTPQKMHVPVPAKRHHLIEALTSQASHVGALKTPRRTPEHDPQTPTKTSPVAAAVTRHHRSVPNTTACLDVLRSALPSRYRPAVEHAPELTKARPSTSQSTGRYEASDRPGLARPLRAGGALAGSRATKSRGSGAAAGDDAPKPGRTSDLCSSPLAPILARCNPLEPVACS